MASPCPSLSIPSCTSCPFWYACSMSPLLYSCASGTTMPPVSRCSRLSLFCRCIYKLHICAWVSGTALRFESVRPTSTRSAPGPAKARASLACFFPVTSAKSFSPSMVIFVWRYCPSFSICPIFSICPPFLYPPSIRSTRSAPSMSRLYLVSRFCTPSSAPPGWLPLLRFTS